MRFSKKIVSGLLLALGVAVGSGSIVFAESTIKPTIYSDPSYTNEMSEKVTPDFKTNKLGETYGNATLASTFEDWPDLVEAVGDNGIEGYIRVSESFGEAPSSPEEAIRLQEIQSKKRSAERTISLYAKDGVTVLDAFTIGNDDENVQFEYFQYQDVE